MDNLQNPNMNVERTKLSFSSDGIKCAACLYLPKARDSKLPCVVMGHGFTGTMDQLAPYAERFAASGLAVLTFDYRHFGESGGQPRQVISIKEQMEDWRAAISLVRQLPGVDPKRIAIWGSSLSGGYVLNLAAEDSSIAAVVAQVPALDKSTRGMAKEAKIKMEKESISLLRLIVVSLQSLLAGVYDEVRGLLGFSPFYIPVFGKPGQMAAVTDRSGYKYLDNFRQSPTWRNEFAPRFLFGAPRYEPGTAEKISAPVLICVAANDSEADPEIAAEIADKIPQGELKSHPASHFDAYFGETFEKMVKDETEFLRNKLLNSNKH